MNKWLKISGTFGIVALVSVVAANTLTFAQSTDVRGESFFGSQFGHVAGHRTAQGDFLGHPPRPPGKGHGLGGEVTAIDEDSLTLINRDEETVEVALTEETQVHLVESQSEGTLEDITVGSKVKIRPNRDAEELEAADIAVLPAGDEAGGRVTAIEGDTITVENRDGETSTIVTTDETEFRISRDETGTLDDVSEGKMLNAHGETQEDGSLQARIIMIREQRPPKDGNQRPPRPLKGEVSEIAEDSLTLTTDEETFTVNISEDTRVFLLESQSEGTLEDITLGTTVDVKGRPNEDNVVEARGLVVLPEGEQAGGRVTGVDGNSITVENREGETTTIVATDETEIRINRDETGSLDDVSEDRFVIAFGEAEDDGSLSASLILVHEKGPGGPHDKGPGGPKNPEGPRVPRR